ncbi:MAG: SRPBCC family protein [Pseudorhodoplanes sp.]
MDIEKKMVVAAPIERVWRLLLDPKVMAGCVPGVQSVDVLSDTEYLAEIKVKMSFISANFRIKTTILETRPPHYLRCEGTGEDSSVASSLKQTTEMFLTETPSGTEIRTKTHAEVFGRLGSFGLSVMKTKADRMWEEFGANLAAILRQDAPDVAAGANARAARAANPAPEAPSMRAAKPARDAKPGKGKWWSRLTGSENQNSDSLRDLRLATDIYLEVHRGGDVIKILWPAHEAKEAAGWLREIIQDSGGPD